MKWTELKTKKDLYALMRAFGGFHDGCIREMHIWTKEYVRPDLGMVLPGGPNASVRMLAQRQWEDPSAIELLFEDVIDLHFYPTQENLDGMIFDASFILKRGVFYWAASSDWTLDCSFKDSVTWVAAKKVSWRDASDWMGEELRYHSNPVDKSEVDSD